jgi:hypothetical protein
MQPMPISERPKNELLKIQILVSEAFFPVSDPSSKLLTPLHSEETND